MKKIFDEWCEGILGSIKKRAPKNDVWLTKDTYTTTSIRIAFPEGQMFWMSFDSTEFRLNNYRQRQQLVRVRRQNLARDMEDFVKRVSKVAKRLGR